MARCKICLERQLSGLERIDLDDLVKTLVECLENDSLQTCSVCLGIFFLAKPISIQMKQALEEKTYDSSDYSVNLSVPNAIYLREKIIEKNEKASFKLEAKDVLRKFLEDELASVDGWKNCISKQKHEIKKSDTICIDIILAYKPSEVEAQSFKSLLFQQSANGKRRNNSSGFKKLTRNQMLNRLELEENAETIKNLYPLKNPENKVVIKSLVLEREVIYLTGSYLKFSREISQTAWFINGIRKGDSSIEELIYNAVKGYFRSDGFRFSGAGREDIDVRMLGNGRPFVLQLLNAKRSIANVTQEALSDIEQKMNSSEDFVKIRNLNVSTVDSLREREAGEKDKKKHYLAIVWSKKNVSQEELNKLNSMSNIVVKQKTPIRVLHRRTLLTRDKMIYSMNAVKLNENFFKLSLCSSAGTYIKEFVHGDLKRTRPSLSSLLNTECDILQLDVEKVELNFNTNDNCE